MDPPYVTIANELRQRIRGGELRTGDKIASTRALARKWKVALATADGRVPHFEDTVISTVIAGLGGRPITRKSLREMLSHAELGTLPDFSFLDLRSDLVESELARIRAARRSGPSAENMLRDLGVTASGALD